MTQCKVIPTETINGGLLTTTSKSVIRTPEKVQIYGKNLLELITLTIINLTSQMQKILNG